MTSLLAIWLPLLLAYLVALRWIVDIWLLPESYYSHGPLIPLVALWVLWQRRARWSALPSVPDPRGWALLGPGLAVHFAGAALMVDSLSAASLVLSVPGAAWLAHGPQRARVWLPAFGLLLFAVPLPLFASGALAFELKEFAVSAGTGLAQALGLQVQRDGASLTVAGQPGALLVEDPCGGLRSLLALTTLAYCFAFALAGAGRGRIVLLLVAVPLALGLNVVRIAFLCFAASWWGVECASGTAHDWANAAVWVVALLVLLGLDRWLDGGAA